MNLERWISRSIEIQSIPAPSLQEGKRSTYVFNAMKDLHLEQVSVDDQHNVYAQIPGQSRKPLVISAHLDTVFPLETNLTSRREGDRIYGPGIGDNSIAVGVLLELAHDLCQMELPNDIWLVGNIGEEGLGNLRGMRNVVKRFGADVLAYIVLEGMALGHIYNRALPIHRSRITLQTPGGHAWIHAGRISAIHSIGSLTAALSAIELQGVKKWSLNIGRISGGTSINTIAPEASLELDLRAEDNQTLDSLEGKVTDAIDEIRSLDLSVTVEEIGNRPGGELPPDHPIVKAAIQGLESVGISDYALEIGSTDASIPISLNYPAVCIGLTYGSGAHSLDEYIELEPLEMGYNALMATLNACLNLD